MIGLIIPGGWEEFFRFIGEPYSGPMWPMQDDRNFFEVLLPKLKQAAEKFDMVPCPQQKSFDPQPWLDSDNKLPGTLALYFLKRGSGPAYVLGGLVCRPLITTAESNGKFAIGLVEGSCQHQGSFKSQGRLNFSAVHHAFYVVDGKVRIVADGSPTILCAGELAYLPKGTDISFQITSRFARMYVFCNGGGLVETLQKLGEPWSLPTIPEEATTRSADSVISVE